MPSIMGIEAVDPMLFKSSPELPPTPPKSESNSCDASDEETVFSGQGGYNTPLPKYPVPPPSRPPTEVLKEDLKTPDFHVPRDPRLIRLTGIHPFNVEPPLTDLFNEGFLTSPELFYVRNHGPVPQVEDSTIMDWEFSIEGLVKNSIRLTLRDLIESYNQITVPVTLVCAGNRRKEQNQVRKSKGFSWGAAGVSTALWTGVALLDVIRKAQPMRAARYVCMEGADKLPNGYYGTSVKLNWVMDPNRGIMLAYKMNGEMLSPDHGKPLRVIIPGQIGGRSVKWLKRIILTAEPSSNWYHIYDNRVLPTMVSPDQSANEPKWWMDDRYAIYDLSPNSATAFPAHDERLYLENVPDVYRVRGYAYSGGGRRITRVEVTLDKGRSWALANIRYFEDDYRDYADEDETLFGGKIDMSWRETCFAWCFWEIDIKVSDLKIAGDLMVRAMDESMNVQPRDMYWSVLGMMNNPWYRITITNKADHLLFEHPTQPALMPGGWMEKVKAEGGDLANGFWGEKMSNEAPVTAAEEKKEISMVREGVKRMITFDELRQHDQEASPWFVLDGEVYDGTAFLEGHPGGATSIVGAAGQDATDEFLAIHSETAKAMMPDYHIGTLDEASRTALKDGGKAETESTDIRPVFLDMKTWRRANLSAKKIISTDTRIFSFKLEHEDQLIGLPVGQHLMIRLRDPVTREAIIRSYTPISEITDKGVLHILIKVYFDTPEQEGGKMTKALNSLPCGHWVDFKGPIGKFEYLGKGNCSINNRIRNVKKFIMICAGSGITPIFQVLRAVLKDREDETKCLVLDGNRNEEDILCREDIDSLTRGNEDRCKVHYLLTKPPDGWSGLKGRIGKDLLEKEVGTCTSNGEVLILICGPEALEKSVHKILNGIGWKDEDLMFF
ncbi:putative nitrate reductase [Xylogone sp. PMI_703]|nr:putative nitrate reductase [Xylogone sp. PMI_703]